MAHPAGARKPNFFILGAGKSGTTSLYHCLRQHPEIYLSPRKEPSFFSEGFQVVKCPIEYFALFDGVRDESRIGEASHVYMTNPSTARVLRALFPEAKFLVILRNPADRAYSLYHDMRRNGWEWAGTFEKALELEEMRFGSEKFRYHCPQYFYNFLYFRSGLYGEQLQRYFSLFESSQFHVLTLGQLKSEPAASLRAICEFLEVNPEFEPGLEVHNEGRTTARFPQVHHFCRCRIRRPRMLKRLAWSLSKRINRCRRPAMRPETRQLLLARYQSDLSLLAGLVDVRF